MGARAPAHCVSGGLAQLAAAPPERVDGAARRARCERFTAATMTDADERCAAELAAVRERGYAINRGAYRPDVGGVGTAVHRRARPPGRGDQHLRAALPPGGAGRRAARRARGAGRRRRQPAAGHADAGLRTAGGVAARRRRQRQGGRRAPLARGRADSGADARSRRGRSRDRGGAEPPGPRGFRCRDGAVTQPSGPANIGDHRRCSSGSSMTTVGCLDPPSAS